MAFCRTAPVGLTVFGCEQDEAEAFHALSPRYRGAPAIVRANVAAGNAVDALGHRCVSVGHKSAVTAPVLRALREVGVEHVSTRSIGFDHIDRAGAEALGITVENAAYAPDGVADYTLMLILMAIRNVTAVLRAAERHDFRLGPARGHDLRALTVGVVGVGHIGTAVIERLQGFGARVLASNGGRRTRAVPAELVPLGELLAASDVVTLHLPLTAETHHVIGRQQVETMKPGAILVNTSRGALVDTAALVAALETGRLGGAALDVLEVEDGIFYADRRAAPVDHPLLRRLQQLPTAIVTPHTAYYTHRALHDTVEQTLLACLRFERNRTDEEAHGRDRVRGLLRRA